VWFALSILLSGKVVNPNMNQAQPGFQPKFGAGMSFTKKKVSAGHKEPLLVGWSEQSSHKPRG